ncbi:hypothetical protein FGO68_gene4825 [Halteria grandinella]|uniref:Uncharacterized protein n=1 Tax=Halteria grandinella TaxID=5974 RepID=A0A8J8SXT3_HALGN|nr:hypothetical protein FGO68_gene4825 [Halteria grandinella]
MAIAKVTIFMLEFLTNVDTDPEIYFAYIDSRNGNELEFPGRFKLYGGHSAYFSYDCYCYGSSSSNLRMRYGRWEVFSDARRDFYADQCDKNYTDFAVISENDYTYRISYEIVSYLNARPASITSSPLASVTIIGGEAPQYRSFTGLDHYRQGYEVSGNLVQPLPSYITNSNFTITIAPPANAPSQVITVQYRVFNTYVYSAPATFTVTVIFNDPPVLVTGINDFSISVGQTQSKTIVASDAQGSAVTLTVTTTLPTFFTKTGFVFNFSPPLTELSSTKSVSYTLSDGVKTSGPFTFVVTVVNLLPVVDQNIINFSMFVGSTPQTKSLVVSDPEGNTVTSALTVTLPSYISKSGHSFTFSPTYADTNSTFTVQFTLSDGPQTAGPFSFLFTVINRMPVAVSEISDFNIKVGSGAVQNTFSGNDPDGNSITLSVTSTLPAWITNSGFTFTINPPFSVLAQVVTVIYSISDSVNTLSSQDFKVTVINDPPILEQNIDDFLIYVGGGPVTKSLVVSDPEGATVTSATTVTLPSYITKSGHSFTFTPTYLQGNSTFNVLFTISDGPQFSGPYQFKITVENRIPIVQADIQDFSIKVGSGAVQKTFSGYDPDGNSLTLAVTSTLPSYITRSSFVFTINPPFSVAATVITVTYTINDQVNTLPTFTFQVTIINEPPILNQNIADFLMYVGGGPISKALVVSDPENGPVSSDLAVTLPSYITKSGHSFTFTPTYLQGNSTFSVIFTLSDVPNTVGPFVFNVVIENREPVVVSTIQDFSKKVGSGPIEKTFVGYDPDGNSLALTVTSSLPAYITQTGFVFTINPSYAIAATIITVTFTISDAVNILPQFSYIVTVINDPPIWTETIVDQKCKVGHVCYYAPGHLDPEGNVVGMTFTGPPYITKSATNVFIIAPSYVELPGYIVVSNIILSDGVNYIAAKSYNVEIINFPPETRLLSELKMRAGSLFHYYVPESLDPEGNFIITTVTNLDPIYATFNPITMTITFSPSYIQPGEMRTISVHYFDGALTTTCTFKFTLINEEPVFVPDLVHQNMTATFAVVYTLPIPTDPDGNFTSFEFLNVLELPDYATWIEDVRAIQLAPLETDTYNNFICIFNISDGLYMLQFKLNITINPLPKLPIQYQNLVLSLNNLGPPYFATSPLIVLQVKQQLLYELPEIQDPDNDQMELPEIDLGISIPFASLVDLTKIYLIPQQEDLGQYQIRVILRDINPYYSLSKEYIINIEVRSADSRSNDTSSSNTPIVLDPIDEELKKQNRTKIEVKTNIRLQKGKIDQQGVFTIRFNPYLQNKMISQVLNVRPLKLTLIPPNWNGNSPKIAELTQSIKSDPDSCKDLNYTIISVGTKEIRLQLEVASISSIPPRQVRQ